MAFAPSLNVSTLTHLIHETSNHASALSPPVGDFEKMNTVIADIDRMNVQAVIQTCANEAIFENGINELLQKARFIAKSTILPEVILQKYVTEFKQAQCDLLAVRDRLVMEIHDENNEGNTAAIRELFNEVMGAMRLLHDREGDLARCEAELQQRKENNRTIQNNPFRCLRSSPTGVFAPKNHFKLLSTDPFERGKEHGLLLKTQIKTVYDGIFSILGGALPGIQAAADQFEQQIPDALRKELQGLAEGMDRSYKDVALIHTFLDILPGRFACTSMATKKVTKQMNCTHLRIAAANHSLSAEPSSLGYAESCRRRNALLDTPIPEDSAMEKTLQAAEVYKTIQSMVFDTSNGTLALSSGKSYAASGSFRKFGPNELFGSHQFDESGATGTVHLVRNLDWPWNFLGEETIVLTRSHSNGSSTASISWPGYIGTLSGINSSGLALAANACNAASNCGGIPNPLLFTHILDTCKNLNDTSAVLAKKQHGSSMNLMIADKTSAKSYELGNEENLACVGTLD